MRSAPLILMVVALAGCSRERERGEPIDLLGLHEEGILDAEDPDFHGRLLEDTGYDFALCQSCHGDPDKVDDFSGGASGKPCTPCHQEGPTSCGTCHDEVPQTGAHAAHLAKGLACASCHQVPARWNDPGHLDEAPAEVSLTGLAAADLTPPRRDGPPAYDAATGSCDNVYCHGDVLGDPAAAHPVPRWTGGADQGACGACHGTPPADHVAGQACASCHPRPSTALHVDGLVQLGNDSGTCSACHGSGDDPAPPRDLSGARAGSALGVGAHRQHLEAHTLRGPIACQECHQVPATMTSPGHIDSDLPAEVFPPGTGALASARGSMPAWERATATCSGVYCHGSAQPVWTRLDFGEASCGTCHGVPPPSHEAGLGLTDCSSCHGSSVDEFGNILLTGPPGAESSEHIDGDVDF